jgi:hypothetical protein
MRSTAGDELDGPMVHTMRVPRIWLTSEPRWPDGPQLGAGDRQVAGQGAETKEGVALGGAHLCMRDDDGPGPLTHGSAS